MNYFSLKMKKEVEIYDEPHVVHQTSRDTFHFFPLNDEKNNIDFTIHVRVVTYILTMQVSLLFNVRISEKITTKVTVDE